MICTFDGCTNDYTEPHVVHALDGDIPFTWCSEHVSQIGEFAPEMAGLPSGAEWAVLKVKTGEFRKAQSSEAQRS